MHARLQLSLTNFHVGVHDHDRDRVHGRVHGRVHDHILHVLHVYGCALHENGYGLSFIVYEYFLGSLHHLFYYGHDYIFIQANDCDCGHDLYFFTHDYGYDHHGHACSFCGHEHLFSFLNQWMIFFSLNHLKQQLLSDAYVFVNSNLFFYDNALNISLSSGIEYLNKSFMSTYYQISYFPQDIIHHMARPSSHESVSLPSAVQSTLLY